MLSGPSRTFSSTTLLGRARAGVVDVVSRVARGPSYTSFAGLLPFSVIDAAGDATADLPAGLVGSWGIPGRGLEWPGKSAKPDAPGYECRMDTYTHPDNPGAYEGKHNRRGGKTRLGLDRTWTSWALGTPVARGVPRACSSIPCECCTCAYGQKPGQVAI